MSVSSKEARKEIKLSLMDLPGRQSRVTEWTAIYNYQEYKQ